MVEKSCENCANAASCKKTIGYMFGFCNTDFKPKDSPRKEAPTINKYFYLAVTVKQNKNESIFTDETPKEPEAGFYSYVVKCSESDNLKSKLEAIGGLQSVNICPTKKRAAELVTFWNDCHKTNGTYLFDTPAF